MNHRGNRLPTVNNAKQCRLLISLHLNPFRFVLIDMTEIVCHAIKKCLLDLSLITNAALADEGQAISLE